MKKNNILKKILATGMIAMTALFCTGLVAHAEGSDNDARIEDYEKFMQAIQEAWDEAIQEASWVSATETTATQEKSKYQTKTTTTTQSKSKYQSSTKTTTTQSKSKYQSSTKTTTTTQSKSKYQSSTNTTTATQDKLKYKKYNENFDPDRTLHLKKDGKLFKSDTLRTWYFYHFSDRSLNGIGKNGVTFHGLSSEKLFAAKIHDNRNLVVSFKAHDGSELNDITIETNNDTDEKIVYNFIPEENKLKADLYDASFRNGLYRINITYDKTQHAYMYLYVNCASNDPEDYEFYLCYAEQHYDSENFDPMKRQKDILDLFESEGVTPENTIDNSYIVYPAVADKENCDTPYWINKAHELIDDHIHEYSATTCALVLHDWMTSNLTYDWFKINKRNGYQRYYKTKYEADPSQYMSKTKTGVCLDYAIVYTIMCREFNIPCVVLSNNSHAWNAINIDGEWIEVDLTADINRYTYEEDLDDVEGTQLYCYAGFMSYVVNKDVPDTATRFCFQ